MTQQTMWQHWARVTEKLPQAKRLAAILQRAQEAGVFTHGYAAGGSLDHGEPLLRAWCGAREEWFDLASVTKALVTVPTVFYEQQRWGGSLEEVKLGQWLPPDQHGLSEGLAGLSIASLLQHRGGLPPWRSFWISCSENASPKKSPQQAVIERCNLLTIKNHGDYEYSDIGYLLLGFAIAAKRKQSLAESFYELCERELGFEDLPLRFGDKLHGIPRDCVVPTGYCRVRSRFLQGEVHDENASLVGGIAGHAGIFARGDGLFQFIGRLWRSELGQKIVAQNAEMRRPGENRGLYGWQQGTFGGGQYFGGGQAIGHLGFTGTAFWLLPEPKSYAILLTNRVINGRTSRFSELADLRREVFSLFNECLLN